ncbi:MAG: hypothetical protein A2Y10_11095 [Planctomycetes bacterium GWF2_41_51]|nr:MAG: hypothetical protein A2Y10_11095 [Planctomycetes bacterium GWF2_41_51]HBG28405.1 hypothetical protein [Phycisphaerales bacterium]
MRTTLIAIIFVSLIFCFGCKKEQPQVETNVPAAERQLPLKEQEKQKAQENITTENMNQELEKVEEEIRQDINSDK